MEATCTKVTVKNVVEDQIKAERGTERWAGMGRDRRGETVIREIDTHGKRQRADRDRQREIKNNNFIRDTE